MTRELELKLSATKQELDALDSRVARKGWNSTPPVDKRLRSIYFDTPSNALYKERFSIRVRKIGNDWRQTVKGEVGVSGGLSNPVEVECDIDGPKPDLHAISDTRIRKRLKSIIGSSSLAPIFETDVSRKIRTISVRDGSKVELALDRAAIKAEKKSDEFAEIELELKKGNPSALLEIATHLTKLEPLRLSELSKSERGYHLLLGTTAQSATPVRLKGCKITAGQSCDEAFRAICSDVVKHILHNWQAVLDCDAPEGPHQLRIGIRYLRTVLRAFDPVFDSDELRELESDLRDLGRIVGKLRDLDVLIADIVHPVDQPAALDVGFAELEKVLSSRLSKQRNVVRQTLLGPQCSTMQIRLALLPSGVGWKSTKRKKQKLSKPVKKLSGKSLDKCWAQANRLGKRVDTLSIAQRHSLRKKLKTLRYTMDAFSALYPKKECKKFIRRLKHLQNIFGYLNDAALAWQLLELETARPQNERPLQQSIGFVIGYHTSLAQTAWEGAKRDWEKLQAAKRPWR